MLFRFNKTSKRPPEPDISPRLRHPVASRTQLGSHGHKYTYSEFESFATNAPDSSSKLSFMQRREEKFTLQHISQKHFLFNSLVTRGFSQKIARSRQFVM